MFTASCTSKDTNVLWFAGPANGEAQRWLLCVPHGGAGAMAFAPWRKLLPPEIGLRAVQPPGREARFREPSYRDVSSFVRDLLPSVVALADRPIAIFGHSLGAIVAFELVREMRRAGLAPSHLHVSGRWAPHIVFKKPRIAELSDEALVALLRGLGGTPADLLDDPDLRALFLPPLRADLEMNERYEYLEEDPLDVPITAYAAVDDERVRNEDVAEWSLHTTGQFELVTVEGGHFGVMTRPEVVIDRVIGDAEDRA
jgi:medium-chain acyl-[acyl-carrier-protein] hydrolase